MPIAPDRPLRPDIVIIDVEASGLHEGSYPIEIGWCDDALRGGSFLIKPPPSWSKRDWSWDAEQIHGISWAQAQDNGISIDDAVDRLTAIVKDHTFVLSDQPIHDRRWLATLYRATERPMPFGLTEQEVVIGQALIATGPAKSALARYATMANVAERAFDRPHRAFADARANAALLRFALDPTYFELIRSTTE